MFRSAKLKITALASAIAAGIVVSTFSMMSSGISQSVEVGGANLFKAIRTNAAASSCAYTLPQSALICSPDSTSNLTYDGTSWVLNKPFSPTTLTPTAASGAAAMTITGGARIFVDGTRYISGGGTTVDITGGACQAVSGFVTTNAFTSNATSGNQFVCGGAATCNIRGASGQTTAVDCGGGTCAVNIGTTNATSVVVGRSGQPVTLTGTVTGTDAEFIYSVALHVNSLGTGIIAQHTMVNAGTFIGAKYITQAAGVGAGNLVLKLCIDGATCAVGKVYTTCTLSCTTAASTVTTCAAGDATTWLANDTLSWSIATACSTEPVGNAYASLVNG